MSDHGRLVISQRFVPEGTRDKALSRVMRAAVPIPAVADASVSHSAPVGGSVVGVVGLLSRHLGSLTAANWVSFDFNVAYSSR